MGSVRVWFTSFYVRAGNTCYVSETSRHLFTHLREHLVSDRTSHIFKHLHNSPQCRTLRSDECFRILDYDSTTFQLKIKEAIHIQWKQPTLNHQIYHVNLKLSLSMLTSFFYYCFCLISILLYTLNSTKSELKMTEELSKHVFKECRLFS